MNHRPPFVPSRLKIAIAGIVAVLVPMTAVADRAGTVYFATGDSKLIRGGRSLPLRHGTEVNSGDTIETGHGRAQVRFTDGGFVSLQPDTTFRVDDYEFQEQKPEKRRGFFSLLKGGLRAISGLIGRRDREKYRLKTPVATIGIRGTEYLVKLNGGLYVSVGDGSIWVYNDAGELVLLAGQSAHVSGPHAAPELTRGKPVLPPEEGGEPEGFVAGDERDDNGNPLSSSGLRSGSRYAVASSWYGVDTVEGGNSIGVVVRGEPDNPVTAGFDDHSGLLGYHQASQNVTGAIGDASLTDVGSDAGVIGWSRWTGGSLSAVDSNPLDLGNAHHVVGIPTARLPTSGTVTYNLIGATRPTDSAGNVGTVHSGTMMVSFGATPTINTALALSVGGNDYLMGGTLGMVSGSTSRFTGSVSATDSLGSCPSGGCGGSAAGFFAGTNASHAGYGYYFSTPVNGTVNGAAAFRRGDPGASTGGGGNALVGGL